ncbi:MAG: SMC family ATPase [Eubacterium sp.]|nr:SMC family ATPase [Eubacterium sp.]
MRPISIKMSAFGPYAGSVEIDMERLGENGLYLITGDTGAGKTTIFDAICFALFGEPSGPNRDTGMFRSKYASPETPTEVEMVFLHAGKKYTVKRNPEYMRPSKKGDGVTKQVAEAELNLPDGNVVSKVKDVTAKVEDILGINREQFSQISMLAQGDFLKLLLADTKERMEIFREIFKTSAYQTLQTRLEEERKLIYGQVEDNRKSVKQYIDGILVDKDDVLSIEVDKAKDDKLTTEDTIDLLDRIINQDIAARDRLDAELAKFDKEIEIANANIGAAETLERAKQEAERARKELETETPKQSGYEASLKDAEEALKGKSELEKAAHTIEAELPRYDEIEELRAAIKRLTKETGDGSKFLSSKNEMKENASANLEKQKAELASMGDSGAELEKLKNEKGQIEQHIKASDDISEELKNCERKQSELESAQERYRKDNDSFAEKNEIYESMEQRFRDGQAGILADKLKDGEPCPVCGSTHHPARAHLTNDIPSEKELDEAKKAAAKARDSRDKSSENAGAIRASLGEMKQSLVKKVVAEFGSELSAAGLNPGDANLRDTGDGETDVFQRDTGDGVSDVFQVLPEILSRVQDDNTAKLNSVTQKIKAAEQTVKRKMELEKLIPENEKKLTDITAEISDITRILTEKSTAKTEKEKQLEKVSGELKFEGKNAAEAEKSRLLRQAEILQKSFDNARKACDDQKLKIGSLKTKISTLEENIRKSDAPDLAAEKEKLSGLSNARRESINVRSKVISRIDKNEEIRKNIIYKAGVIAEVEKKLQWVKALADTANGKLSGKNKIMLETYIQTTYFDRIIRRANLRLMTMSDGQYELTRMKEAANKSSKSGLDLGVIDHYNGSERSVKTLSGGESFIASLSLALGLSDEVQASAGGIKVETMFVDEGFGSLDSDSLDMAYKALAGVTEGNKLVGIISHVSELKVKIDKQVIVTKEKSGGSKVEISV